LWNGISRFGEISTKHHQQIEQASQERLGQWMMDLLYASIIEEIFTKA